MNNFLPIKSNHRAAPLRLAARIISIMILAFLWPVRGGAQEQTPPSDLNVSNITDATTLTYKKKSDPDTYAWYYKIGEGEVSEFTGTLTGSEKNDSPVITIKSEKDATSPNYDDCAKLILNGVSLTAVDKADLIKIAEGTKPLCIKTTGNSSSTLKGKNTDGNSNTLSHAIYNYNGGILILDGEAGELNILGEGDYTVGLRMYNNSGRIVSTILKNKVTIKAGRMGVWFNNAGILSAIGNAKVKISSKCSLSSKYSGEKAFGYGDSRVQSPFLQWTFDSAPESGKTLKIKKADGNPSDPVFEFSTDGEAKSFAVNVTKDTGYTLWLGDEQLMDKDGTTVFTATDDKLFDFSGMRTFPADWPDYAQTANVGTDGIDVSVSGTNSSINYTVKTPRGLAWIAWVTNNAKTKSGNTGETYTAYYPTSAGFNACTVTLANDISLATPAQGVANDFDDNWIPIGIVSTSDLNNVYTKCFQGTFDGNNKNITEMKINTTSVINTGLFGYLYGATVKDLTMAESNSIHLQTLPSSETDYPLGSIAGYVENGIIMNCHNKCEVKFSNSDSDKDGKVGGIAGTTINSVLSACSNSGAITINGSTAMGGGIVGVSTKSSIASCFNTGKIDVTAGSGAAYAGGIMGGDGSSDTGNNILHCYSTGNITAKATQSCPSGGIVGGAQYVTIKSCFATGSVSAESSSSDNGAYAGGIIGGIWSNSNVTVKDCLALNVEGVKATGNTSDKQAGRIVGKNNNATLSNNYASTKIKLTIGNNESIPTENITAHAINGANLYLDKAAAVTASWAGSENTKAFTAIGTDADGKLPQLKTIASYGNEGLPVIYGEAIPGQPAASLTSADYLAMPGPLSLPVSDTDLITLSYSDGKWSYKKGEGETSTRFNGTVKMTESAATSTNKLVISTATGNPTLTFEKVEIKPTDGAALTINADCALTINTADEGTSTLSSSGASTLINKGILTLTGKGLYIGNTGDNNEYYALDNSGTFTVSDPSSTSVTFHCANTAIHNIGTLANAWMEWQFADASGQPDGKIAFAATDDDNQSPAALLRQSKTYATTVTPGKTYRLWTVTSADGEVRTRQQGKTAGATPVPIVYFQATAGNDVAVFTGMKDAVTATVTQPTKGGGSISVFCNDSLVTATDVIPNGAALKCKYSAIPGYQLDTYTATPSGGSSTEANSDPKNGSYQVPDDAISVAFTATFRVVQGTTITEEEVVLDEPTAPVAEPTVVIPLNERPSVTDGSTIKLVTGALEEESHKTAVDKVIEANVQNPDQPIYVEIALVEVKSGGTKIPIQPSADHPVTVIYPYPAGTDAGDTFTIVHVKMDGTTEVYSVSEGNLENTVVGLKFSVSSFSPFGIVWTKAADPTPDPDPVPDPTPVYYTVTLPALEGATTDPAPGNYEVESWSSFRFYFTLDKDYDQSVPVVTTSRGETITPRASDGAYLVKYIRSDVTISIAGIQKNTDVANATIEAGVKVWTEPSALCLETDRTEEVRVITVSGSIVAVFDAKPGMNRRPLTPGLYVVQTGRKVCKVIVK